jgi:hypothetical protein
MSSYHDATVFEKKITLDTYSFNRNGSRENYKAGVVDVTSPEHCIGTQYIGIENPSSLWGVTCAIEVVAVTLDGWKADDKQKLHDAISTSLMAEGILEFLNQDEVKGFTTCILTEFTSQFKPQDFEHMAEYEIDSEFRRIAESCFRKLGLSGSERRHTVKQSSSNQSGISVQPTRKALIGTWRDDNSVFTLKESGGFYIIWDNQNQAWGDWKFENGMLYIKMGEGQPYITHEIRRFTTEEMMYHAVGDNTVYTAKKLK